MYNASVGSKPTFFQWKINIFDEKTIVFQWAVLSWSWGGLVAPGAGQERSHAAWRFFFVWFPCCVALVLGRGGAARSAPMQCGARFLQKQCFPCSVALVLGSDDTQTIKQTINQTNHQTDMLAPIVNVQMHLAIYKHICHWSQHVLQCFRTCWLPIIHCCWGFFWFISTFLESVGSNSVPSSSVPYNVKRQFSSPISKKIGTGLADEDWRSGKRKRCE